MSAPVQSAQSPSRRVAFAVTGLGNFRYPAKPLFTMKSAPYTMSLAKHRMNITMLPPQCWVSTPSKRAAADSSETADCLLRQGPMTLSGAVFPLLAGSAHSLHPFLIGPNGRAFGHGLVRVLPGTGVSCVGKQCPASQNTDAEPHRGCLTSPGYCTATVRSHSDPSVDCWKPPVRGAFAQRTVRRVVATWLSSSSRSDRFSPNVPASWRQGSINTGATDRRIERR